MQNQLKTHVDLKERNLINYFQLKLNITDQQCHHYLHRMLCEYRLLAFQSDLLYHYLYFVRNLQYLPWKFFHLDKRPKKSKQEDMRQKKNRKKNKP
jgi:hypothetical protein